MPLLGTQAKIKAIFFDIYGTLIDIKTDEYDPLLYNTFSQFLSYMGVYIGHEELKDFWFGKIAELLKRNPEEYPEVDVLEVFRELLYAHGIKRPGKMTIEFIARLFRSLSRKSFGTSAHAHTILESISGDYSLGIISDAQRPFTLPELRMLNLDRFFDTVVLSSDIGVKKPNPKIFKKAMDSLGVSPEESLYIGDNPAKDLVGAKGIGMKMLLFRSEEKPYNGFTADGYINSLLEVETYLMR